MWNNYDEDGERSTLLNNNQQQQSPYASYYGSAMPYSGGYADQPPQYDDIAMAGGATSAEADNNNMIAIVPTAPPLEKMDKVPGYSGVTFNETMLPPPAYSEIFPEVPEPSDFSIPSLTEDEAREALLDHVTKQRCWGSSTAKKMTFVDLKNMSAFVFSLETFTESRWTCWATEPYRGNQGHCYNESSKGTPPKPWDISVHAPASFQKSSTSVEVPNTVSIKVCHDCSGIGKNTCFRCKGRSRTPCPNCFGVGIKGGLRVRGLWRHRPHLGVGMNRCFFCMGLGFKVCPSCTGIGVNACKSCAGMGRLKCYIKLTVKWSNHTNRQMVLDNRVPINEEALEKCRGRVIFQDANNKLTPVTNFPNEMVNMLSHQWLEDHDRFQSSERILKQRQTIKVIPITKVVYEHKGKEGNYHVYGEEANVTAENYPDKKCFGCFN